MSKSGGREKEDIEVSNCLIIDWNMIKWQMSSACFCRCGAQGSAKC